MDGLRRARPVVPGEAARVTKTGDDAGEGEGEGEGEGTPDTPAYR